MTTEFVQSAYSHYIIIGCSVLGLTWGSINALFVNKVELDESKIKVNQEKQQTDDPKADMQFNDMMPWD
jgi:hypothetical protein